MKNLLNKAIFKKGNKKMRRIYGNYKDICILCGKELKENGTKNWWTPDRIRQYKKDFQGKIRTYIIAGKEFTDERGSYVCQANNKCIKERNK